MGIKPGGMTMTQTNTKYNDNLITQDILEEVEAHCIYERPCKSISENGITTREYHNVKMEYQGKTIVYDITWIGRDNGEDEGQWSKPRNVRIQ